MEPITIRTGEIAATCETVEQAAALIRALQGAPPAAPARAARAVRKPRKQPTLVPPARTRKAAGSSARGAVKEKILAFVAKKNEVSISDLAQGVYGEASVATKNRAGVLARTCVKRGLLKRSSNGMYRLA
jgi:hypothetical protein